MWLCCDDAGRSKDISRGARGGPVALVLCTSLNSLAVRACRFDHASSTALAVSKGLAIFR